MRALLASTALALLIGLSPASAMCGGGAGQQASAGGMCGVSSGAKQMSERTRASDSQPQQKKSGMGMCPCCRNMASMDGMKADDPHEGMDMPKE